MNLREQLKSKTLKFHIAAEKASAKYAPVNTHKGYKIFLNGMHRMYKEYAFILDKGSTIMKLPTRSQEVIKALEIDLDKSVYNQPQAQKTKVHDCDKVLLGASYVFEGSALGSNVLIKRIPANSSCNYLKLLTKDSPSRWPRTIKYLSTFNEDFNHDATITEACNVFNKIAQTMQEVSIEFK